MRMAAEEDRQEAADDRCQAQKKSCLIAVSLCSSDDLLLVVQTVSKYQAIQQERLPGPQII